MENFLISLIQTTLFGSSPNIPEHEYQIRLQHAKGYTQELLKPFKNGRAIQRDSGVFIYFVGQEDPDPRALGSLISQISNQYPIERRTVGTITTEPESDSKGRPRPVVTIKGILVTISRKATSGSGRWLKSTFILFLVVMLGFYAFARNLSPAEDFASVRLYVNTLRE
jgi:hypothetical protein